MAEVWKTRLRDAALVVPLLSIVGMAVGYGRGMERISARLDRIDEKITEGCSEVARLRGQYETHERLPVHPGAGERLGRIEQWCQDLERRITRIER